MLERCSFELAIAEIDTNDVTETVAVVGMHAKKLLQVLNLRSKTSRKP